MVQINEPINLRVKFKKVGALQYISHLDLVRTMHKIIVRSKLPLWYTEGFNPKPKMVFLAPLSIGSESVVEYVDIRLSERIDPKEALLALNKNMTDEMCALEVYYREHKFTDLKWLSYDIKIKTQNLSDTLPEKCEKYLLSDEVIVEKKSKSKELVSVNIRPLIKEVKAKREGDILSLSAIISGDSSSYLNPELLISALRRGCGVLSSNDLLSEHYSIMRTGAYLEDMSEFR